MSVAERSETVSPLRAHAGVWLGVALVLLPTAWAVVSLAATLCFSILRPYEPVERLAVVADATAPVRKGSEVALAEWYVRIHPDEWRQLSTDQRRAALTALDLSIDGRRHPPDDWEWFDVEVDDVESPLHWLDLDGDDWTSVRVHAPDDVRFQLVPFQPAPAWLFALVSSSFDQGWLMFVALSPSGVLLGAGWLARHPNGRTPRRPSPPPAERPGRPDWRAAVPPAMRARHFRAGVVAVFGALLAGSTMGLATMLWMIVPLMLLTGDTDGLDVIAPVLVALSAPPLIGFALVVDAAWRARSEGHALRGRGYYAGSIVMIFMGIMGLFGASTTIVSLAVAAVVTLLGDADVAPGTPVDAPATLLVGVDAAPTQLRVQPAPGWWEATAEDEAQHHMADTIVRSTSPEGVVRQLAPAPGDPPALGELVLATPGEWRLEIDAGMPFPVVVECEGCRLEVLDAD